MLLLSCFRLNRLALALLVPAVFVLAGEPARTAAFRMIQIDGGAAESMGVADFNQDGKLDVVSAESWYEAPAWTKHAIRMIPVSSGYIDSFSDLPLDVDEDGFTDVIQIGYFARRIVWMKNPGRSGGPWTENLIEAVGPTEFAFLVDLDNDGRARELLPQFTGAANAQLCWYGLKDGKWTRHVVDPVGYHGHGIGAGDVNGDKRNDILTPAGWFEAPADIMAVGNWKFHETDWKRKAIPAPAPGQATATQPAPLVVPAVGAAPTAAQARDAEWGFMYVLDLNGDGRNDVLTSSAHSYGLGWFEQKADGAWTQHIIDHSWSHLHATVLADVNGDGQPDLVTGKRFQARNRPAPGDDDPLGLYWYEFKRGAGGTVTWTRQTIDYGSKSGGGLQMAVRDIDGDGDMDVLAAGKTGLFLAENLAKDAVRK